ncbi:hypothetical protein [uncultured Methanobrevibacter sp.]|uniref:hypothetical protein n=1 Tax=uncultured Methanobrevibacter sp. TaxID=253161 RepID=UPI0025DB66DF|nr:hypothetical protein [uncultured Methanobrevibacter sp.]
MVRKMNLHNEKLRIIRIQKEQLGKMIREENNEDKRLQYVYERMMLGQEEEKLLKEVDLE